MRHLFCFLLLFSLAFVMPSFAQTTALSGVVRQKDTGSPIGRAVVTVRNAKGFIQYSTTTSQQGKFNVDVKEEGLAASVLVVSCMGYKPDTCRIADQRHFQIDLQTKDFVLKKVYVDERKITHRNDTTHYMVSAYTTANDRTIGDALRKMPGMDVSKDGTVSYNGKAVDGLMVEGVDLFDGQYNIATRNVSHDIVSSVDVIENYHSEKMLRESKKEGGTVINLNLKDKAKGRWSGNLKAGLGVPKLWLGELFDANLSDTRQTAVTAKSNNNGKDIASENKVLTLEEYLSGRSRDQAEAQLGIQQDRPGNLDEERSRNGRTHIINVANVKKLSSSALLNTKIYYDDDRNIAYSESNTTYFLPDSTVSRTAKEHSVLNTRELGVSVQYKSDSEKGFFLDKLQYTALWQRNLTRIAGDYDEQSKINSDEHAIDNTLRWIFPVVGHRLTFLPRTKYTIIPENAEIRSAGLNRQRVNRKQFYTSDKIGFTCDLRRWSLGIDVEGIASVSDIASGFVSEYADAMRNEEDRSNFLALAIRPELAYKHNGLRMELELPLSAYHFFGMLTANKLYCKPQLTLSKQVNEYWKVRCSVTAGSSAPYVSNAHDAAVMVDYKTFRSSPISVHGNVRESWQLGFSYTDYANMVFANGSVSQCWSKNNRLTVKRIEGERIYYSTAEGDNKRRGLMAFGSVSKRISAIKTTVSARGSFVHGSSRMIQNGSDVSFGTDRWQLSADFSSNVCDWLEAEYSLNYSSDVLKTQSLRSDAKSMAQKLDMVVSPIKAFSLSATVVHYLSSSSVNETQNAVFGDVKATCRYQKLDFSLSVSNIFNQKRYCSSSYTDLSGSYTMYALRGRNVLAGFVAYF